MDVLFCSANQVIFAQLKKQMVEPGRKILLIDSGNSRIKFWALRDGQVDKELVFPTSEIENAKHLASTYLPDWVVIVNSGQYDESFQSWFPHARVFFYNSKLYSGVHWKYKNPDQMGKDRMAALVGAHILYPEKKCLVVGAGTCLTIDALKSDGTHLGGVISPGLKMRFQAMHENTKMLPLSSENEWVEDLGNSTLSCLAAGAVGGMLAEIETHFHAFEKDDLDEPVLILSGGDADFLAQRLKVSNFVRTDLVFQGMIAVLANLN